MLTLFFSLRMRRGHNVVRNIVAEKFARSAFDSDESDESLPHPHQPRHTRNAQLKKIAAPNVAGYIEKTVDICLLHCYFLTCWVYKIKALHRQSF
jgi:hypothetical protein